MNPRKKLAGFTLIELMIVIAIMGIIVTMGVPMVYRIWHKQAMRQALSDICEVCGNARAQAILQGKMTTVVFHPKEHRLEVNGAAGYRPAARQDVDEPGAFQLSAPAPPSGSGLSAQISDRIMFEMLDINLSEFNDADSAVVRFFPNGTCDETKIILVDENGERRGVELEITTSFASVVPDIR